MCWWSQFMSDRTPDEMKEKPQRYQLEFTAYDNEPIWEQTIRAIVETRQELAERLDRIYAIALETRADLRNVEDRVDGLEPKSS